MSAILLKGIPVEESIRRETIRLVQSLAEKSIVPCLAIIRIGEIPDQLSYERIILRKAEQAGISVRQVNLPAGSSQEEYDSALDQLSENPAVHGILPMRPLPRTIEPFSAFTHLRYEKDVDGCSERSLGILFSGSGPCFAPCTAQAVLDMLVHYQIPIAGKKAVIIGRSLVVGKPLSQLLLKENATVTVCHSHSINLPEITKTADILVSCAGKPEFLTNEFLSEGQTILDVGINWIEPEHRFVGDVRFSDAVSICHAITPVPGGIGSVTTARLLYNTCLAARLQSRLDQS